jgi:hypothetical protein
MVAQGQFDVRVGAPVALRGYHQSADRIVPAAAEELDCCISHGQSRFAECQNPDAVCRGEIQLFQPAGQRRPGRSGSSGGRIELDQ